MSVGGVGSVGVGGVDLKGMDLETAMMMVQTRRTELLESQLKDQIDQVSKRNDQIAKLNSALSELNRALNLFDGDAKSTDVLHKQKAWKGEVDNSYPIERAVNSALIEAGLTNLDLTKNTGGGGGVTNTRNPDGSEVRMPNGVRGDCSKGQLDAAIQKIKGLIDAESNSQQMDMLRLQSLSNKRNEAFDLMTNFIKKMHDGRASIVGNMR